MMSVMNLLSGTVMAGLAESLALSEKVALDGDQVMQVLEASPLNCPLVKQIAHGKELRHCATSLRHVMTLRHSVVIPHYFSAKEVLVLSIVVQL